MLRLPRTPFVLAIVLLASAGCSSDAEKNAGSALSWPGAEWETKPPDSQGMDAAGLDRARAYAFEDGRNTQGLLVVRHGVIVGEWYAPGATADSWATSWSVAKSFTSALVGMALDEGLIENVDVSMARYIPEWAGTEKEKILLRHVLQMAPGLAWNEDYDPNSVQTSDVIALVLAGGKELAYAAGKGVVAPPGTAFDYSSGTAMLLSAVVQGATGMSAGEYARKKLFAPLGMRRAEWWQSTEGHTLTFCCLDTTTRDFARFGLLYARGGEWSGTPLVSSDWVEASTAPSPARPGYGFQWWLLGVQVQNGPPNSVPPEPSPLPPDTFAAIGVDDQIIYVVPHLDLVVVRNGTYVKDGEPAIATPALLNHLPPSGVVPGKGTLGPKDWDFAGFLQLILDSIRD